MKNEVVGQIMEELFGLKVKTYSYLKDSNSEDKKNKRHKKTVIKRKLKFQDYEGCLEAAHTENKINDFEKNKIDVNSLNDFIKNNKLILKTQPR